MILAPVMLGGLDPAVANPLSYAKDAAMDLPI
jgi:hypothetical protein